MTEVPGYVICLLFLAHAISLGFIWSLRWDMQVPRAHPGSDHGTVRSPGAGLHADRRIAYHREHRWEPVGRALLDLHPQGIDQPDCQGLSAPKFICAFVGEDDQ